MRYREYILVFIAGVMAGVFITGLMIGSGQVEREEAAYRCGYEQGRADVQNNVTEKETE